MSDPVETVSAEEREPQLFSAPAMEAQERMVEAMLFATPEPITTREMQSRMPVGSDPREALENVRARYEGRGVQVVRVGEGWAMRTAPDMSFLLHKETVEQRKLSRAATETLAIIAYHQPVTRAEIEEIRGVAVSRGTLDLLLELDWIRFGRRRMTPGRPVTFVVTQSFLDHFSLESARDLPALAELRSAGLLDSRRMPGEEVEDDEEDIATGQAGQSEMFEE
ncbi:SMC-Scp complex subunit ScpB [Thioclava sp. GXIMD4216]|uniref:SMC-Scp complex subunit ScpB n=1 Tax=Thioclava litoralis TaxID=3076557 RepID=A0ABZ1DZU2_9RHOB|nr:SMC-Scp complex subunit ScpB [Thioclava sp. FTW29]